MKNIGGYNMEKAIFAEIKGEGNYMTNGYIYLGWGGINRAPSDSCKIWVNHEAKVWCVDSSD